MLRNYINCQTYPLLQMPTRTDISVWKFIFFLFKSNWEVERRNRTLHVQTPHKNREAHERESKYNMWCMLWRVFSNNAVNINIEVIHYVMIWYKNSKMVVANKIFQSRINVGRNTSNLFHKSTFQKFKSRKNILLFINPIHNFYETQRRTCINKKI